MKNPKPFWNDYVAGIALGLVLLGSFVVTGKGLGASGSIKHVAATVLHSASPTWAEENKMIGSYFGPHKSPLDSWLVFLGLGVLAGGFIGALTGRRLGLQTIRGPRVERNTRLVLAFVGGLIAAVGAAVARGCSSGQILTGGSQLAVGSWVIMLSFFATAYGLAYFFRKQWI